MFKMISSAVIQVIYDWKFAERECKGLLVIGILKESGFIF